MDVMRDIPLQKIIDEYKPKNRLYLQMSCAKNITKFPLNYDDLLHKNYYKLTPNNIKNKPRNSLSELKLGILSGFMDDFNSYRKNKTKSMSTLGCLKKIDENPLVELK
jgi:hypothetical protein